MVVMAEAATAMEHAMEIATAAAQAFKDQCGELFGTPLCLRSGQHRWTLWLRKMTQMEERMEQQQQQQQQLHSHRRT